MLSLPSGGVVFDNVNWNVPVSVFVSAVDDSFAELLQQASTVLVSVDTSRTADYSYYNSTAVTDDTTVVIVDVTDNDAAQVVLEPYVSAFYC